MMIKHKIIIQLIQKLKLELNFSQVEIRDYWDACLLSIGLVRGNKMVYIAAKILKNRTILYDYDFEILDEEHLDNLHVIKEVRDITEEELIKAIKEYLDV